MNRTLLVVRVAIALSFMARPLIAVGPFDVCDAAWIEETDRWVAARCYFRQAVVEQRLADGAFRLDALIEANPNDGWLFCARGHLALAQGDSDAIEHYKEAHDVFGREMNAAGELLALQSIHHVLLRQRRTVEASWVVEKARLLLPRLHTKSQRVVVDVMDAQARRDGGDLVTAQRLLTEAVSVLEGTIDYDSLIRAMFLLASVSRDLGHWVAAEGHYERVDRLAQTHDQPWAVAGARLGIALLRLDLLERRPTASGRQALVALFDRALAAARAARNRSAMLHAHRLLGDLRDGDEAKRHHDECIAMASEADVVSRAACARSVARRIAPESPVDARRLLEEALALDAGVHESSRAWFERSVLAWQNDSTEAAWAISLRALDSIERLRQGQKHDGGRVAVFSLWLDAYYHLTGALLNRDQISFQHLARAFQVSERMRARVLLETLRWVEVDTAVEGPSGACSPADLTEVQAALADDEAVLSYLLNNQRDLLGRPTGGSWLLMVTRDDARAFALPDRMRLEPTIDVTLGLIPRRDDAATAPLARLHQQLLAPALAALPAEINRLTIIPDGALHGLPFAALLPERDGPPVGTRLQFAYAPSASLLVCQRRRLPRVGAGEAVLLMANPVVRAGRLPHARREAHAVRAALGSRVDVRLGKAASESTLQMVNGLGLGVLHLAAHAVIDHDRPERSAVLLSSEADEDGRLEPHEILDLDLRGTVVVLSACRSAGGAISSGEGVMSLARSFFQAGASAVVGGLWALEDDEAADVVALLYQGLARGETLREALANAQRSRIEAGSAPADWAGLIALGDTDRRLAGMPIESSGVRNWAIGVTLFLLTVCVVGLWWHDRSRRA